MSGIVAFGSVLLAIMLVLGAYALLGVALSFVMAAFGLVVSWKVSTVIVFLVHCLTKWMRS